MTKSVCLPQRKNGPPNLTYRSSSQILFVSWGTRNSDTNSSILRFSFTSPCYDLSNKRTKKNQDYSLLFLNCSLNPACFSDCFFELRCSETETETVTIEEETIERSEESEEDDSGSSSVWISSKNQVKCDGLYIKDIGGNGDSLIHCNNSHFNLCLVCKSKHPSQGVMSQKVLQCVFPVHLRSSHTEEGVLTIPNILFYTLVIFPNTLGWKDISTWTRLKSYLLWMNCLYLHLRLSWGGQTYPNWFDVPFEGWCVDRSQINSSPYFRVSHRKRESKYMMGRIQHSHVLLQLDFHSHSWRTGRIPMLPLE